MIKVKEGNLFPYVTFSRVYTKIGRKYFKGVNKRINWNELTVFFFLYEKCNGLNTGFNPYTLLRLCPSVMNHQTFNISLADLVNESLLIRKSRGVYVISEKGQELYYFFLEQTKKGVNTYLKEFNVVSE